MTFTKEQADWIVDKEGQPIPQHLRGKSQIKVWDTILEKHGYEPCRVINVKEKS